MKKTIVLLIAFVININFSNAQWQQTSLDSVNAFCFATNGTDIFIGTGTNTGVYLSTDYGTNWNPVNTGITPSQVFSILINGTNIFAATNPQGVYLSTNNGASWTPINNGLTYTVSSLNICGSNVFAGTFASGVFLSQDTGISWIAVNNGLPPNSNVWALAVNGTNIFSGIYGHGIYLSTDNGTSWSSANIGLTDTLVSSIAISGTNIFAGTSGGGVFFSPNNGTSWTAINTGLTNFFISSLIIDGTDIFAGTRGGVFRSNNNGLNWTNISTGLIHPSIISLIISGPYILAGADSAYGVWRRPLSELGIEETVNGNIFSVYPIPANDNIIIESTAINKDAKIFVYDIQGKLLLQRILLQSKTDIDISNLAKGLYTIKFVNLDKIEMIKFLKE